MKHFDLTPNLSKIFIGADQLKNKELKEVDYLVDQLFPRGTLCALVGESDTGKSSLLRQLAVSVAYGDETFIGFKLNDKCRNVVYVSTEDGEMGTSVWLNKHLGEDITNNEALSQLKFLFITDNLYDNIRKVICENCIDLLIIDSYADIFEGSMNDSNVVRSFLTKYNDLANQYGITIIFLHHTKKSSEGMKPNKNSILGSQGFEAKMRSVMMLTKDKDDDSLRHLCVVKNNYLSPEEKKRSYVIKFNENLSFESIGKRVNLDDLDNPKYLQVAKDLRSLGKSLNEIVEALNNLGFSVKRSTLHRKLNK